MRVVMMDFVFGVSVAGEDIRSVVEIGSLAGEDVGAGTDHIYGEGELLAVEDEEVSVFVELILVSSACSLASLNSVLLV